MTAPLKASSIQWSDKRGIGRDKSRTPSALHVDEQPCRTGTHELVKHVERGEVVVFCCGCGGTWADLDADLRKARGDAA